ncbi:hypothetical protein HLI_04255 [Halobacillus litoralis]|uniref:Uncharacterized protein n=1 Tax=Halobacillus litoralis TaxID=45668 RepID=A0A410M9Y6_9BACI|nr:hypothetical protein HLI_04255 [Halobacillus litoralis]
MNNPKPLIAKAPSSPLSSTQTKQSCQMDIKGSGNNDPLTVTNTIHQIAYLVKSVGQSTNFSP